MSKRRSSAQNENSPGYSAKRAELMALAAEVFKEKGFEATTLNDIAERFGTDRASIYYYFASKKELFQALFHDILSGVLNENVAVASEVVASDMTVPDKLRGVLEQVVLSYEKNYPYVYLYIQEDMTKLSLDNTAWARDMARKTKRLETIITDVLQKGVDEGVFRSDVPVILMARAIFGMINWTHRWLKPGMRKTDARQTVDAFCAIFFDGAMAQK
jgi:AcrR family transcriptional regulator